jgi:primosomal protein N' (replication factor Y)
MSVSAGIPTAMASDTQDSVSVVLPRPVDRSFDYLIPPDAQVGRGSVVTVPFGKGMATGVVVGAANGDMAKDKLKTIAHVHDFPPLREELLGFMEWTARYTMTPLGLVARMAIPEHKALDPMKARKPQEFHAPEPDRRAVTLTHEQSVAAEALKASITAHDYNAFLLDGVTGSGKTEVYFEAIAQALRMGRQVLVMLPEIALTRAFLDRFADRFGAMPATWHSHMTPAQRRQTLRAIATGQARVVVGARSALFLPYPDLGLIVIDEEHDTAYKQEDGVLYHGRDMAVVRAKLEKIPVVLASATPSLESMHNVWSGKYRHLVLPDRFGGATMPEIHLIDMRKNGPASKAEFISPVLRDALKANLESGRQSLLYLNRRGYAPLTLCRSCGHRFQCPNCTAWLVDHRRQNRLQCHHCGYAVRAPNECPECKADDALTPLGPGIERLTEEVQSFLPQARLAILSSDTTQSEGELLFQLARIYERSVDIIIGTQIIAKGHHLPDLTCVGVIDADLGLSGGDLRAAEHSFQLLQQVAGRAGRVASAQGVVYIQTYQPEARVIKALAAGERDTFMDVEAQARQDAAMPPYARLAAIIVSGNDEKETLESARDIAVQLPGSEDYRVLGPAQAPLYRLRGKYRQRLLVQAAKACPVQDILKEALSGAELGNGVDVRVDIDPQSFL